MPHVPIVPATLMIAVVSPLALSFPAEAQQPSAGQVEALLKEGWEVTGYVAAWENRTLILLKHREKPFLMQCSVLIDVTRSPRVVTLCYEIR